MFPKLSQKALNELGQKNWHYVLNNNDREMPFYVAIEEFMSLFDLEKYPITKDMVFEYLKDHPDYSDNYYGKKSTVDDWNFYVSKRFGYGVQSLMSINEILKQICEGLGKDQIIIIGEIHGWWEKGETK